MKTNLFFLFCTIVLFSMCSKNDDVDNPDDDKTTGIVSLPTLCQNIGDGEFLITTVAGNAASTLQCIDLIDERDFSTTIKATLDGDSLYSDHFFNISRIDSCNYRVRFHEAAQKSPYCLYEFLFVPTNHFHGIFTSHIILQDGEWVAENGWEEILKREGVYDQAIGLVNKGF